MYLRPCSGVIGGEVSRSAGSIFDGVWVIRSKEIVTSPGLSPVAPGMGTCPSMFMLVTCHGCRVGVGVAKDRPEGASEEERGAQVWA